MIKVIAIGGAPGTGKTSLVKGLIAKLDQRGEREYIKMKLVRAITWKDSKVTIIGVYDGRAFEGTDALSMAVQPDTARAINATHQAKLYDGYTIVWEGDRLTNGSMLAALKSAGIPTHLVELEADDAERQRRYKERGSAQPEKFIQGRVTKYLRLREPFAASLWPNNTKRDQHANISRLARMCGINEL